MDARRIILAALLAAATVTGIACNADGPSSSGGRDFKDDGTGQTKDGKECDPSRVPSDKPNIQGKRYVTVYACVESVYAPMTVSLYIVDHTTGERHDRQEPAAGGTVQFVIGYDTGHNVTMDLEMKPARAGSRGGFLYVTDGPGNRKLAKIDGAWRSQIQGFKVAR